MKCPKCQFENPEMRKFCRECGVKLILLCPKCNSENFPGDKFCGECGHNLTVPSEPRPKDLSFDEKIDRIQSYLPKGLTEKILAQRGRIEGERRQVTIMFCDMKGFTPLTEKIGPDETFSLMDQVYEILIHKVNDYQGTVNELRGDGILAFFGAPIALEDAPQRAIRSALAIQREMTKFNETMRSNMDIPPVLLRIGINSGPVVVGTVGNDLRVQFTAMGDTINMASRMEGLAEPGTTYVTEETFNLTEGFFRFEALGAKKVKGKDQPMNVYRVITPTTRRTRFDVSTERGLTRFVGRERELELLLDAFERAKIGRGQAFSIMAEAGVGKSRLLYEFRKAVANENVTFLEGKCLSYSRGVAYHPVIDILKANFDIRDGDGSSEIKKKAKKQLKVLGVDEASTLPYLLELLSVKDSGIDKIPMSPEGRKDRIMEALKRIVLKGSEIRPLIMAVEDLHWIDKSSEDAFKDLLANITGAKIFLIFTYRPEYVGTWGGKSYHSQVNLNRLSNRESLSMVANLLGTENIAGVLEDLILEKTEGVPFFIEEFVKSLRDLNMITRPDGKYRLDKDTEVMAIPSTIRDVLMARVESLPEGAREVLQTGSVIEREFSYELIKKVMDLPEKELLSYLSALKDSELLYERGIYPESTYIFKHALTRDVVYDSILAKKRKVLHEKIGSAVEEISKENIGEHVAALTEHFIRAENYEKGAEYAKLARKRAQKAGSFNDAIEYGKKGLFCLERLPKIEATQKRIIDERNAIAVYYMNLGNLFEARQFINPIVALAVQLEHEKRLPGIYTVMALYNFFVEENYSQGFKYIEQAVEFSVRQNDYLAFWMGNYYLANFLSFNCEFEKGLSCIEKCQQLSELANNPIGMATTKSNMAMANYISCGKIDYAYETSKEALLLAKEADDILAKGLAYTTFGYACYCKGLFSSAEKDLLSGTAFCEKINQVIWMLIGYNALGLMYFEMEDYEKAERFLNKAISTAEHSKVGPSWISFWKICLARLGQLNNDRDMQLSEVMEHYNNIRVKYLEGYAANHVGEILLNIDDQHMNEAYEWINKAIETDKRNGVMFFLAKDYALCAEFFKRKGDKSEAKESLKTAIETFKECGADGWVEKYEKELVALS